jgi:hypothetical protein
MAIPSKDPVERLKVSVPNQIGNFRRGQLRTLEKHDRSLDTEHRYVVAEMQTGLSLEAT